MGKPKSKTEELAPSPPSSSGKHKELPPIRPGTSGTENLLMMTRQTASEQFVKAQQAEKTYRLKKRAALARTNYKESTDHFRRAFSHLNLGMRGLFSAIMAIPSVIGEKRQRRKRKTDAKKREKTLERKKRLEEALTKAQADANSDNEEGENSDGEEKGGKSSK